MEISTQNSILHCQHPPWDHDLSAVLEGVREGEGTIHSQCTAIVYLRNTSSRRRSKLKEKGQAREYSLLCNVLLCNSIDYADLQGLHRTRQVVCTHMCCAIRWIQSLGPMSVQHRTNTADWSFTVLITLCTWQCSSQLRTTYSIYVQQLHTRLDSTYASDDEEMSPNLTFSSSLVITVLLMPSVLLTGFLWSLTTKMSTSNSGQ